MIFEGVGEDSNSQAGLRPSAAIWMSRGRAQAKGHRVARARRAEGRGAPPSTTKGYRHAAVGVVTLLDDLEGYDWPQGLRSRRGPLPLCRDLVRDDAAADGKTRSTPPTW